MCVFPGECFYGWLEPLLDRLVQEPTTVVSPSIAIINKDNLQFIKPVPSALTHTRGKFDWILNFGWENIPEEERVKRKDETYPVRQMMHAHTHTRTLSFHVILGRSIDIIIFFCTNCIPPNPKTTHHEKLYTFSHF